MPPKDEEDYGVQGCHGTIAPQQDETHYDDRSDASDDIEKGRLKFPKRLYGRERELETLLNIYNELAATAATVAADGDASSSSENGDKKLSNISEEKDDAPSLYSSRVVFLSGYSGIGKSGRAEKLYQSRQKLCIVIQ